MKYKENQELRARNMIYLFTGLAAFLLFIFYDINAAGLHYRFLGGCFFIGCVMLFGSTVGILAESRQQIIVNSFTVVCMIIALVFLALLVYTLFVVLPFRNTYLSSPAKGEKGKVCSCGVYALSRHPGVLWFTGIYLFLSLAIPTPLVIQASMTFCVCNILYVIFQDLWTFPRTFRDYSRYKETVPFLLPTAESIRRCTNTLNSRRKEHNEV